MHSVFTSYFLEYDHPNEELGHCVLWVNRPRGKAVRRGHGKVVLRIQHPGFDSSWPDTLKYVYGVDVYQRRSRDDEFKFSNVAWFKRLEWVTYQCCNLRLISKLHDYDNKQLNSGSQFFEGGEC